MDKTASEGVNGQRSQSRDTRGVNNARLARRGTHVFEKLTPPTTHTTNVML